MYPAPFTYHAPTSLEAVLELLSEHGDEATLIAGGQSLVPMMAMRLATPELLVDLGRLPRTTIRLEDDVLVIPAATRHVDLQRDPLVARHAPAMATAARHIGNVRVRNRGTIGGSLAHADPAAEWPCVLSALSATVELTSTEGTRMVAMPDFIESFMTTDRRPWEVLTHVRVPIAGDRGQAFVEVTRRANDFAVVEAAAVVAMDDQGHCREVSLSLGGVGNRPMTLTAEEAGLLHGHQPDTDALSRVVEAVVARLEPHDDVHGSAWYRLELARSLGLRALELAVAA